MVAMRDATGFKYFLSDHLGSVSVVLSATGTVLEQQRYLPFGQARVMPPYASVTSTDFTYTGQRNLPGTGLMDYKARFYSPTLGRFIQPDSIIPGAANPQSWNRFSYVTNNPTRYNDPTGHMRDDGYVGNHGRTDCSNKNYEKYCTPEGKLKSAEELKKMRWTMRQCESFKSCFGGFTGNYPPFIPLSDNTATTLTTVNIGGVNPASVSGVQDDDSVPTITNVSGSKAYIIPLILSMINSLAQKPNPSTDVDVLLSYVTSGNGSIDNMVVTVNNHDAGSTVYLSGVVIKTGSTDSTYLQPTRPISVSPGQIEHAVICDNCIGQNKLSYNMPINRNVEVTVAAMIGGYYNYGAQGTMYGELPVSYTIPPR